MTPRMPAFTLIELIIVMSIIALLILIFIPQIPAIMSWYRVHLSHVVMTQLEFGVEEYRRVYGSYPDDLVYWNSTRMMAEGYGETSHFHTQGYESLCLALQGPDGTGWGPTEDFPGVKEFGPIPESPGYVGTTSINPQWSPGALGKKDEFGMIIRTRFEDAFGTPILYYRARIDSRYPDVNDERFVLHNRYVFLVNKEMWWFQRGADELAYGRDCVFEDKKPWARRHFTVRLTRSRDGKGNRYPYNPTTYILWLAGADQRFGYWVWSDQHRGFVADTDPENTSDGRVGVCDDLLNCGG